MLNASLIRKVSLNKVQFYVHLYLCHLLLELCRLQTLDYIYLDKGKFICSYPLTQVSDSFRSAIFYGQRSVRLCQIGILLSVNSSLTNLGTYLQTHTNRKRKHNHFVTKTMHYIYIFNRINIIIIWNNGLNNLWNDFF